VADSDLDTIEKGNLVGGFLKGLKVIQSFDNDRQRQSIADISRATGFDRASCRRLLLTLVHAGFAEHDGKYFWLSPRVLRLSYAYLRSASLPNILQSYLETLSGEIHESCSASVLEGNQVVYIARASYQRVMSINLRVGSALPIHCSSMGRVLLAGLPPEEARQRLEAVELVPLTSTTCTSVDALIAEIDRVREQGFAIVDQELEVGLRSIAVPVYDARHTMMAAINIGTNAARVPQDRLINEYLVKLMDVQKEVARVL
jgi:IclR family pca regulon transcriptional regulator